MSAPAWADQLLRALLARHPLPWTIDQDWTWEVIAADGTCIAKFQKHDEAYDMVRYAEEFKAEDDRGYAIMKEFLLANGIDLDNDQG
jgi:hypothetical protein